jgi:hypothetical protein
MHLMSHEKCRQSRANGFGVFTEESQFSRHALAELLEDSANCEDLLAEADSLFVQRRDPTEQASWSPAMSSTLILASHELRWLMKRDNFPTAGLGDAVNFWIAEQYGSCHYRTPVMNTEG